MSVSACVSDEVCCALMNTNAKHKQPTTTGSSYTAVAGHDASSGEWRRRSRSRKQEMQQQQSLEAFVQVVVSNESCVFVFAGC